MPTFQVEVDLDPASASRSPDPYSALLTGTVRMGPRHRTPLDLRSMGRKEKEPGLENRKRLRMSVWMM
jgi:hypothetical protein